MTVVPIKGDVSSNKMKQVYDFWGLDSVSPNDIQSAINSASDDELDLEVASNGGDVFAASEIYTMLKNFKGTVNVQVQGLAASAASVIAMAGDKVSMSPTSLMMVHKASSETHGNSDDMRHSADVLDKVDSAIVPAYEAKTGMNQDELLNVMRQETWLNAKDAVDKGFADEVSSFDDNSQQLYAASAGLSLTPEMIAKARSEIQAERNMAAKTVENITPQSVMDNAGVPQAVDEKPAEQTHNSTLVSEKLAILFGKKD